MDEPKALLGGAPNTGSLVGRDCKDDTGAEAVVNEKKELDEAPLDELKSMGAVFVTAEDMEDAPIENPVGCDNVELEPKIEVVGLCQLELKALAAVFEPIVFTADEVEELPPKLNIPEAPMLPEPSGTKDLPPKLNFGRFALLVLVEVEAPEPKPKLNTAGVDALLELIAFPSVLGLAPNLNTLDVCPLPGVIVVVSDEEAEDPRPNILLGFIT